MPCCQAEYIDIDNRFSGLVLAEQEAKTPAAANDSRSRITAHNILRCTDSVSHLPEELVHQADDCEDCCY
jgi:hypothetical protein